MEGFETICDESLKCPVCRSAIHGEPVADCFEKRFQCPECNEEIIGTIVTSTTHYAITAEQWSLDKLNGEIKGS